MPFYALSTIPLIDHLGNTSRITQLLWYADDASSAGSLTSLREWWGKLVTSGPAFGYHANASKSWLITKEQCLSKARELFGDMSVNITCQGGPYLGAPLSCDHFCDEFVRGKVAQWEDELSLLAHIAITQPNAAFVAFAHGMIHRFTYVWTTPGIGPLLQPLEDIIQSKLIPAWTGRAAPNCTEHKLFAVPACLGGLSISILPDRASDEISASVQISAPLKYIQS